MTHIEAMKQTLEAWASDFLRWRPKPPTASRRTTMTEAERLADELKKGAGLDTQWEAAAELRRLQAEVSEQCRINGMGAEREAKLMAEKAELLKALGEIAWSNNEQWRTGRAKSAIAKATGAA